MQKFIRLFTLTASVLILFSCTPTTVPLPPKTPAAPVSTSTPAAMACTILHFPATPEALGAEFGDHAHIAGPANAPVTIVVFSDYQCPACAYLAASLKQIRLTHATDVRFIFVNTPISGRDKDAFATQAVEAADLQGKFWEMHDLLFEKQAEWSALTPTAFENWTVQQALSLKIDPVQFQKDFEGKTVADRLQQAVQIICQSVHFTTHIVREQRFPLCRSG